MLVARLHALVPWPDGRLHVLNAPQEQQLPREEALHTRTDAQSSTHRLVTHEQLPIGSDGCEWEKAAGGVSHQTIASFK